MWGTSCHVATSPFVSLRRLPSSQRREASRHDVTVYSTENTRKLLVVTSLSVRPKIQVPELLRVAFDSK
ncbi:hypothetical protein PVK06_010792 [Gossypium arboreum]|uniref:Uncharacterized protein n=1 Tax=Gossypium arboreum TaxID=29729 RepID=A0ABR0Q798_GOSAR|nr:hypothetical protein PVK06_010792 [Gossypium arboreum]